MLSKGYGLSIFNRKGGHTSTFMCFSYYGMVYGTSKEVKACWVRWERNAKSHGGKWKLRLVLTDKTKRYLVKTAGTVCLGTNEEVFGNMKDLGINKGEAVEKYICEAITGTWHKDYTPWYEGADLEYKNLKVQIKYEGATIASLYSLEKFAD